MRFVSGHCWAFKILTSLPDGFNNFLAKFAGSVQIFYANSRVKGLVTQLNTFSFSFSYSKISELFLVSVESMNYF